MILGGGCIAAAGTFLPMLLIIEVRAVGMAQRGDGSSAYHFTAVAADDFLCAAFHVSGRHV